MSGAPPASTGEGPAAPPTPTGDGPAPPTPTGDGPAILRAAETLRSSGGAALRSVDDRRLEAAFLDAVAAFRDPSSPQRRGVDPALRESAALSQGCLDASLAALLDGFSAEEVRRVIASGRRALSPKRALSPRRAGSRLRLASPPAAAARDAAVRAAGDRERAGDSPHLIVLAGSLPGIALAPLLATLAVGRPAILKSSSREPFFAPAFVSALAAREPALGDAIAAVVWRGGDPSIESPLLREVGVVVAYGGARALADLRRRAEPKLIAFGPKASVAIIAGGLAPASIEATAAALARDTALFDQRGCLSLQAIYADGDVVALAAALAGALEEAARRWPPLPLSSAEAGALRSMREEAAFLGCDVASTPLDCATVVVDRRALFLPSPGHRTVRIHPVADADAAIAILGPHAPRLQGVAVAGEAADRLGDRLAAMGVSYVCAPGELQSPGASWRNGGIDLVAALAGR